MTNVIKPPVGASADAIRRRLAVVGSVNLDLRLSTSRIPRPGETIMASTDLTSSLGGKGANQAVAVQRLGGLAGIVASVGIDPAGDEVLATLRKAGVDVSAVVRDRDRATGTAVVMVEKSGENAIVVSPGANAGTRADSVAAARLVGRSSLVLAQMEIPIETVAAALRMARCSGAMTVLNAAPIPAEDSPALRGALASTDTLVVNSIEAIDLAHLLGFGADGGPRLLSAGPRTVIVTRGGEGIDVVDSHGVTRVPPIPALVVDTTGAGDATCAAIAVRLAEGCSVLEAATFGVAAGSWAVRSFGTTESYGDRRSIERLLRSHAR